MQNDQFIRHLYNKYIIIDKTLEQDEANSMTIYDIQYFVERFACKKTNNEKIVKELLKTYNIYNVIDVIDRICETSVLCQSDISEIVENYKKYKETQKREQYTRHMSKNTYDCSWYESLNAINTDELLSTFGEWSITSDTSGNIRYEYVFIDGKNNTFTIHDYINESGEFYNDCDIYWHISTNCANKQFRKNFVNWIIAKCGSSNENTECC